MTIIYPINGKNERLGSLFKTPKHLLLYNGIPAIECSVSYMKNLFPEADIIIISQDENLPGKVIKSTETKSQIETLNLYPVNGQVMFVDCDIIPVRLNKPQGDTVYLFKNELWMKQYSNYKVEDGMITDCNEKGEFFPYAGSGIYYFEEGNKFYKNNAGCKSISEVIKRLLPFNADIESEVFRFGTLNDIKNDSQLI